MPTDPNDLSSVGGQPVPTFRVNGLADTLRLVTSNGTIVGWIDKSGVLQGSLAGEVTGVSGSSSTAASADSNISTAPSGDVVITDGAGNIQDSGVLLSSLNGTEFLPWGDIQDYGGLPLTSASVQSGIGATTVSGSPNVTLATNFFNLYKDLANGQGVCIWEAGNSTTQSTPSAPTITSPAVQGTATLTYQCVGFDAMGGLTAASTSGTVTNAPTVFCPLPVAISSISQSSGTVTVNFAAPLNGTVTAGMTLHITNVTGNGSTFNGIWNIASAPTTSQVTYALAGNAGSGTVSATSLGRLSNSQIVTAVSRAANGVITITTAENHGYQAVTGLHPTVITLEGCTPVDLNGWYIIQSASGNTINCATGVLSAESASAVGSCTVWEYTLVACPALSGTTVGYYIYSDSPNPGGSLVLVGKTITNEHHFTDWGPSIATGYVAPGYVPTSPPSSAQNQMFTSTILSGGGTLNIVLNNNVPTSIPSLGATLLWDDGPNLVAAMAANSQVIISPPRTAITTPGYVFNSPITIPTGVNVTFGATCFINETITASGGNQINAMFGTGALPSIGFGQRNYANLRGIANPLVCIAGTVDLDGLCFTCLSNGQHGVNIKNVSYGTISNCGFTASSGNFGNAIGVIYNGCCTASTIQDIDITFTNRFNGAGVVGQSSWGPPIPAIWVRASDNATIVNAGEPISNFFVKGKVTGNGRGILFDQQFATTNADSSGIYVGDQIWMQQGTTPIVMLWGEEFFGVEIHNLLNDTSEAACLANWASQICKNVDVIGGSSNESFGVVTGSPITSLYATSVTANYQPTLQRMTSTSFTSTSGTADIVTLPFYTGTGSVTLIPTNASAALDVAAGNAYISFKASGQVVVTHSATSGMTFDILGTVQT